MFNRKLAFMAILVSGSMHYSKAMDANQKHTLDNTDEAQKVRNHLTSLMADCEKLKARVDHLVETHPDMLEVLKKFVIKIKPSELINILERGGGIGSGGQMVKMLIIMGKNNQFPVLAIKAMRIIINSKEFESCYIEMGYKSIICKL